MPEIKTISDEPTWNAILTSEFSGTSDVYLTFDYFDLFQRHFNVKAEALYWNDGHTKIFWPHLVRKIEPMNDGNQHDLYDLTSPYGYAGPLVLAGDRRKEDVAHSISCFMHEYENFAQTNHYVSEFIRFHPIFQNSVCFRHNLEIEHVADVVLINLKKAIAEIWKDIRKGHRYDISKCVKQGCQTSATCQPSVAEIKQFVDMYTITMDKAEADKKYYFPLEFIVDHFNLLNTLFISIKNRDEVIGASIFLVSNKFIHYYLSGTSIDGVPLAPSKLILWEAIQWAKSRGLECFNLGSGLTRFDNLSKFKQGFSKDRASFHVGKKIFDEKMYKRLMLARMPNPSSSDFFPAYRSGMSDKIV